MKTRLVAYGGLLVSMLALSHSASSLYTHNLPNESSTYNKGTFDLATIQALRKENVEPLYIRAVLKDLLTVPEAVRMHKTLTISAPLSR